MKSEYLAVVFFQNMLENKPNLTIMNRLAFLFFLMGWALATQAQKAIPEVDLKTLEGRTTPLYSLLPEKPLTVISFWATWCAPCKRELDAMTDLFPEWAEKYNTQVLAITIDDQRQLSKVRPMATAQGWPFTILSDPSGQLKNALNIQSIPFTLLVSDKGEILYKHIGYMPGDEMELAKQIATFRK